VDGVDYVLHLAAIPSVPRSVANPLASNEANVSGTLNLLAAAQHKWIVRAIGNLVATDQPIVGYIYVLNDWQW
jgi:nucleoside-diphosphate-sugar epimerase